VVGIYELREIWRILNRPSRFDMIDRPRSKQCRRFGKKRREWVTVIEMNMTVIMRKSEGQNIYLNMT
jgi:hypothetical protein